MFICIRLNFPSLSHCSLSVLNGQMLYPVKLLFHQNAYLVALGPRVGSDHYDPLSFGDFHFLKNVVSFSTKYLAYIWWK